MGGPNYGAWRDRGNENTKELCDLEVDAMGQYGNAQFHLLIMTGRQDIVAARQEQEVVGVHEQIHMPLI